MRSSEISDSMRRCMVRKSTLRPQVRTELTGNQPLTPKTLSGSQNAGQNEIQTKPPKQEWIDKWLPCIPPTRTAQQKGVYVRNKKPVFYTKRSVKQAAATFRTILTPILPATPMTGPLSFAVTFVYPWPKSTPKHRRLPEGEPISTRPDCSNLVKMLEDVMTEMGFWEDDSQIYSLVVRKLRGNEPGMSIRIGP